MGHGVSRINCRYAGGRGGDPKKVNHYQWGHKGRVYERHKGRPWPGVRLMQDTVTEIRDAHQEGMFEENTV